MITHEREKVIKEEVSGNLFVFSVKFIFWSIIEFDFRGSRVSGRSPGLGRTMLLI